MKLKIILTLVITAYCSAYTLKAEIPQGTRSIGGALSFNKNRHLTTHTYNNSSVSHTPTKRVSFSILPEITQFIRTNLSLGLSFGYMYEGRNDYFEGFKNKSNASKQSSYPLNIICNKYFNLSDEFSFWAGINAGGKYNKYKAEMDLLTSQPNEYRSEGYTFQAGLQFGFIWFPVQKIGITLGVSGMGYEKINENIVSIYSTRETNQSNSFSFNLNTARLSLGMNYFFRY